MSFNDVLEKTLNDAFGKFERFRVLAGLLWPDTLVQELPTTGVPTIGAMLLGILESDPWLSFIKRTMAASASDIPPCGTRDRIISECTDDPVMRRRLLDFSLELTVNNMVRISGVVGRGKTPEGMFWVCLTDPAVRAKANSIRLSVHDYIYDRLIAPYGGYAALAARGKGFELLDDDPNETLFGPPMLAGELLLLIAILEKKHPKDRASLNRATEMLQDNFWVRGVNITQRDLKDNDVWGKHRWLAPLWAGILLEANRDHPHWISTASVLAERVLVVMTTDDRFNRAVRLAQAFCEFATSKGPPNRGEDEKYISRDEIIWFGDKLASEDPSPVELGDFLPTLSDQHLQANKDARGKRRRNADAAAREKKAARLDEGVALREAARRKQEK